MSDDDFANFGAPETPRPSAAVLARGLSDDQFAQTGAPEAPPASRSLIDVAGSAVANIPQSAAKFATDIAQPFIHPIETAKALKSVGHGALQKAGVLSGEENIPAANAVGQFFADRYGGWENLKKTVAEDPVGFLADASIILSGGGTLAARAPGYAGRVGEIAATAGRAVDPLNAVKPALQAAGSTAARLIGDVGTHTGPESVRRAVTSGFEGGEAGRAFRENMRGTANMDDAVIEARNAVSKMRQQRGQEYRAGMKEMADDPYKTPLNFDKIDDALADITKVKTFKGQPLERGTQEIRQQIGQEVAKWKALDPREFHTAEGMDALKQILGSIREETEYGTPARKVADDAYHAVRQTVIDNFPDYAKTMKGYEQASNLISEMERTLSLNPKASVDTALRKLQSVLRNNVNTNYGKRAELARYLTSVGAPHLMEKLAGQTMSAVAPRGLGKVVLSGLGIGGGGAAAAGLIAPQVLAPLALMSPRLVGEAGHTVGRVARPLKYLPWRNMGTRGFQIGRAANQGMPFLTDDSSPFAVQNQP